MPVFYFSVKFLPLSLFVILDIFNRGSSVFAFS